MKRFADAVCGMALAILLASLTSCGVGGGTVAEGGIGGTGISMGRITAFGSVFVNGVEYDTSSAKITADGQEVSEAGLGLGMVLEVRGAVNADGVTGKADQMTYTDALEGIVNGNDVNGSASLTVMGQTVTVDTDTVFEPGASGITVLGSIPVNAVVEVSGFPVGSGVIHATRVEVKQTAWNGQEIELKGVVHARTPTTFQIGNQVIDWSQAASLPDGAPQDGWNVEVKSTRGFDTAGVLIASRIAKKGVVRLDAGAEGSRVELEGVVTTGLLSDIVEVNGQAVRITPETRYHNGASNRLTVGAEVEVKGRITKGELTAEEIEFKFGESSRQKIEGAVTSKDNNAKTVTLEGQTIHFTSTTLYEDERDNNRFFGFADIDIGDQLEIVVGQSGNTLTAIKVERKGD